MAPVDALARHRSASRHEDAAARHDWAAAYWEERGVTDLATLERRFARNERAAAEHERSRALGNRGLTEQ
jgi:hypothetical protein